MPLDPTDTAALQHLGTMMGLLITCAAKDCRGTFIIDAKDRERMTVCPFCTTRLVGLNPTLGRVQ